MVSPSFLLRVPLMKPLTLGAFQPVIVTSSANVAPLGRWRKAITVSWDVLPSMSGTRGTAVGRLTAALTPGSSDRRTSHVDDYAWAGFLDRSQQFLLDDPVMGGLGLGPMDDHKRGL